MGLRGYMGTKDMTDKLGSFENPVGIDSWDDLTKAECKIFYRVGNETILIDPVNSIGTHFDKPSEKTKVSTFFKEEGWMIRNHYSKGFFPSINYKESFCIKCEGKRVNFYLEQWEGDKDFYEKGGEIKNDN